MMWWNVIGQWFMRRVRDSSPYHCKGSQAITSHKKDPVFNMDSNSLLFINGIIVSSCYLVDVTLDPKCTHAKLIIKEKNKVKYNRSPLDQPKDPKGPLIAVANEGYSKGEMYWEVKVGHKGEWELGVLTITARKRLEENREMPLEEGYIGIRWFQGKFHCTGGNSLPDGQNEECEVVGVFLDMNEQVLSFYNVQKMCPIRSIPYEFSEEMYPFFNPGSDDKFLEVRSVSIPKCLISL